MDSLNLFEKRAVAARRRPRRLWVILTVSFALPGLGHFLLGKKRVWLWMMLANGALGALGKLAQGHGWEHLLWLSLRGAFALNLFAVIDAGLLCVELTDGRHKEHPVRARLAAFLSLTTYGGGLWLMEERAWAGLALAGGLLVHGLLAPLHGVLLVAAELGLAVFAWRTYRLAQQRCAPKPTRLIVAATGPRASDSTPRWLIPSFAVSTALTVLALLATMLVSSSVDKALGVRREGAIAMEPYYRNPRYGVSIELRSPGWKFGEPAPDEFVTAHHVGQDAAARLSIRPRVPLLTADRTQAETVLREAGELGYSLHALGGSPCTLGRYKGYALEGQGTYNGKPRTVRIVAAGAGWREYVLWFEWGDRQREFAQGELDYLLRHLTVGKP